MQTCEGVPARLHKPYITENFLPLMASMRQTTVEWSKTAIFSDLGRYIFRPFRQGQNYDTALPRRLSSDPKIRDLDYIVVSSASKGLL